jgi:hypothetical protein
LLEENMAGFSSSKSKSLCMESCIRRFGDGGKQIKAQYAGDWEMQNL